MEPTQKRISSVVRQIESIEKRFPNVWDGTPDKALEARVRAYLSEAKGLLLHAVAAWRDAHKAN